MEGDHFYHRVVPLPGAFPNSRQPGRHSIPIALGPAQFNEFYRQCPPRAFPTLWIFLGRAPPIECSSLLEAPTLGCLVWTVAHQCNHTPPVWSGNVISIFCVGPAPRIGFSRTYNGNQPTQCGGSAFESPLWRPMCVIRLGRPTRRRQQIYAAR